MRPDLWVMKEYYQKVKEALNDGEGSPKERVKKYMEKEKVGLVEGLISSDLTEALNLSKELFEMKRNSLGKNCFFGIFKLVSPGLVGIGSGPFKAVFEVGLNIDPILGLPYYPGSGIKGAIRSFVEGHLNVKDSEELIESIFGSKNSSSPIIFMDMYPIGVEEGKNLFKGLVTNPHYYKEGKPVRDELDVQPIPVQYVGISEGTLFGLISCVKDWKPFKPLLEPKVWKGSLRNLVEKLEKGDGTEETKVLRLMALITVLTLRNGIAARSAKGFNFFEIFNEKMKFEPKSFGVR